MTDLIKRLDAARSAIDKAIDSDDPALVGKMAKRLQPLHAECYVLYSENNDDSYNCKEYHYAEYLRLCIMFYFESLFDYGGSTCDLYEDIKAEAWRAGLAPNKLTGQMID